MEIKTLMNTIREMNKAHGFEAAGRDIFCEKIALIHSELSEALEEFRDGRGLNEVYFKDDNAGRKKPEGIPIEMADAIIRILDFCAANDIDLDDALWMKLNYNRERPYKHGKTI